eukprot:274914-Chlamydomonas_euryale.AAC.2
MMPPRVLVGARTNNDKASSEALALGAAPGAAPGCPAVHFVAEAADGRGALRCARTYFLSQGQLTRNPFADVEEEAEEGYSFDTATASWDGDDAVLLMRTYAAVVAGARAAMAHFAADTGADVKSARAAAVGAMCDTADALGVGRAAVERSAKFAMWECDHMNHVEGAAVKGSRRLKASGVAKGCDCVVWPLVCMYGGARRSGCVECDRLVVFPGGVVSVEGL